MRGLIGVLAGLVGCGGEHGGVVIVNTPADATHVELFVSKAACPDCPSLTPPSRQSVTGDRPVDGDGWLVFDLDRFQVDLGGGTTARFFLENDSGAEVEFPRVLAVALSGTVGAQETVVAAATIGPLNIPDGQKEFIIDLVAADALDTSSENEHVELWRRPRDAGTHAACAVVQHRDGTAEYFVPEDDHDCDDFMPRPGRAEECTDFGSSRPPTLEEASCASSMGSPAPFCRLGGAVCADAVLPTTGCVPVEAHHCLSDRVCMVLAATNNGACLTTPFAPECLAAANAIGEMPVVSCELQVDDMTHEPCDHTGKGTGTLPATLLVNDLGGTCKALDIATAGRPLAFDTTATVGGGTPEVATLTIDPDTFDPATCSVRLSWSGLRFTTESALLRIKTVTGVLRVVPLRVKATPVTGCAGPDTVTCIATAIPLNDTFRQCQ